MKIRVSISPFLNLPGRSPIKSFMGTIRSPPGPEIFSRAFRQKQAGALSALTAPLPQRFPPMVPILRIWGPPTICRLWKHRDILTAAGSSDKWWRWQQLYGNCSVLSMETHADLWYPVYWSGWACQFPFRIRISTSLPPQMSMAPGCFCKKITGICHGVCFIIIFYIIHIFPLYQISFLMPQIPSEVKEGFHWPESRLREEKHCGWPEQEGLLEARQEPCFRTGPLDLQVPQSLNGDPGVHHSGKLVV